MKNGHGGVRKSAGRKKSGDSKKLYSVRLSDKTANFLKKNGGITDAIERMVAHFIKIEKECKIFGVEKKESDFF